MNNWNVVVDESYGRADHRGIVVSCDDQLVGSFSGCFYVKSAQRNPTRFQVALEIRRKISHLTNCNTILTVMREIGLGSSSQAVAWAKKQVPCMAHGLLLDVARQSSVEDQVPTLVGSMVQAMTDQCQKAWFDYVLTVGPDSDLNKPITFEPKRARIRMGRGPLLG